MTCPIENITFSWQNQIIVILIIKFWIVFGTQMKDIYMLKMSTVTNQLINLNGENTMNYSINTVVFGDWKITKEIGEGSYGTVYEIQKTDFGITTHSALKVIRIPRSNADIKSALNEGMDEQSVTSYFQGFVTEIVQEISVMASLKSHPNIVAYEDHCVLEHNGDIGWDILIRMELLTPLQDYIFTHNLNENNILHLAQDICSALAFCQKKGLIHRDIKPENIFTNETGQFKLGDFGVARTIEKTMGGLSKKGTESYMAPEVYLSKPYGSAVDIYSLGLVLYKFMNDNRLPFLPSAPNPITFADRENALCQRMKGEILPPPANASKEFADIILKACAYKPEERYRTAADMLEDIKKLEICTITLSTSNVKAPNTYVPSSLPKSAASEAYTQNEETIGLWEIPSAFEGTETFAKKTEDNDKKIARESPSLQLPPNSNISKKDITVSLNRKKSKPSLFIFIAIIIIGFISFSTWHFIKSKNSDIITVEKTYQKCLEKIYTLMLEEDYEKIAEFCNVNKDMLMTYSNDTYYQNGEFSTISLSNSMDTSSNILKISCSDICIRIFLGFWSYNDFSKRTGCEFYLCLDDECLYKSDYYFVTGNWNISKLCGNAIQRKTVILSDGNSWIMTTSGKVVNDMFNGDILIRWQTPDGDDADGCAIQAEKGHYVPLGETNGEYIYAQGANGMTWTCSEEDLENNSYKITHLKN